MQLSNEILEFGLERYVLELESDGLTVLPPEVTGITDQCMDRCSEVFLQRFTAGTGCPITVTDGPLGELVWPGRAPSGFLGNPAQVLFQQLLQWDRCLRDLTVNPVVDALIDHLMGRLQPSKRFPDGARTRRFSSAQGLIKWQGEHGYGPDLGLHSDQGGLGVFAPPRPWGSKALAANATWCLTDYTREGGALAYVPGSHRFAADPGPEAAERAVAVEAPRGSVIVFHGATWHGAFPKLTPGLRMTYVAYYRHASVHSQENFPITMRDVPWDDCDHPETMRELLGLDDTFPYTEPLSTLPRLAP